MDGMKDRLFGFVLFCSGAVGLGAGLGVEEFVGGLGGRQGGNPKLPQGDCYILGLIFFRRRPGWVSRSQGSIIWRGGENKKSKLKLKVSARG